MAMDSCFDAWLPQWPRTRTTAPDDYDVASKHFELSYMLIC
jgi:hypothetical protein